MIGGSPVQETSWSPVCVVISDDDDEDDIQLTTGNNEVTGPSILQTTIPGHSLPQTTAPALSLPQATTPAQNLPQATTPGQNLPQTTAPGQDPPEAAAPGPSPPELPAPDSPNLVLNEQQLWSMFRSWCDMQGMHAPETIPGRRLPEADGAPGVSGVVAPAMQTLSLTPPPQVGDQVNTVNHHVRTPAVPSGNPAESNQPSPYHVPMMPEPGGEQLAVDSDIESGDITREHATPAPTQREPPVAVIQHEETTTPTTAPDTGLTRGSNAISDVSSLVNATSSDGNRRTSVNTSGQTAHDVTKFPCTGCGKVFMSAEWLKRHSALCQKRYLCLCCVTFYAKQEHLSAHACGAEPQPLGVAVSTHALPTLLSSCAVCRECGRCVYSPKTQRIHMCVHQPYREDATVKPAYCRPCRSYFLTLKLGTKHASICHVRQYGDVITHVSYGDVGQASALGPDMLYVMYRSIVSATERGDHRGGDNNRGTGGNGSNSSQDAQEEDLMMNFFCARCSSRFLTKEGMVEHTCAPENTHVTSSDFLEPPALESTCETCGRYFLSPQLLVYHQEEHEAANRGRGGALKSHKCESCATYYVTEAALKNHMSNCHRSGVTEGGVSPGHIPGVTEGGVSPCHSPGVTEGGVSHCHSHGVTQDHTTLTTEVDGVIVIENDETEPFTNTPEEPPSLGVLRAYRCSVCTHAFKQPYHLANHLRIHNPIKPRTGERKSYRCVPCKAYFMNKSGLHNHRTYCKHYDRPGTPAQLSTDDVSTVAPATVSENPSNNNPGHMDTHMIKAEAVDGCHDDSDMENGHSTNSDTGGPNISCPVCTQTFQCLHNLSNHKRIHDPIHLRTGERKSHQCVPCKAYFTDATALWFHRKIHCKHFRFPIRPGSHQCDACHLNFRFKNHLTKHRQVHEPIDARTGEPKNFRCFDCDGYFLHKGSFYSHRGLHHCAALGSSQIRPVGGASSHRLTGSRPNLYVRAHRCPMAPLCKQRFRSRDALAVHVKLHERTVAGTGREKPYGCHVCKVYYTSSLKYKMHMRTTHGGSALSMSLSHEVIPSAMASQPSMVTSQPSMVTSQPAMLTSHPAIVTSQPAVSEKTWQCTKCHQWFMEERGLLVHQRSHSPVEQGTGRRKPHYCEQCDMYFMSQNYYKSHTYRKHPRKKRKRAAHVITAAPTKHDDVISHDDVTSASALRCPTCRRRITRRHNMAVHMRTHDPVDRRSGDRKPYHCAACGVFFRSAGSHQNHLRLYHGWVKRNLDQSNDEPTTRRCITDTRDVTVRSPGTPADYSY